MDRINPGELREKIGFYSLNRVSDGGGGSDATEVLEFETLASLTRMKGLSKIESGKMVNIQPYKVRMRANPDHEPKPDMKVKWRNQSYTINDIDPIDVHLGFWTLVIIRE